MAEMENRQGITLIKFGIKIRNYCPLGKDWYTNSLGVEMVPGDKIPDYDQVQKDILALDGQQLIAEDAVSETYTLMAAYSPKTLSVRTVTEGNGHFAVLVEKSSTAAGSAGAMTGRN